MLFLHSARSPMPLFVHRVTRAFLLCLALTVPVSGQGIASIQNISSRPFVTGITPIIGRNGVVGGVFVDAQGVVGRVDSIKSEELRGRWKKNLEGVDDDVNVESDFRVVSLSRLDRAIAQRIDAGQPLTEEIIFLAGLRRVEYVFSDPDGNDVLLAGPGGAWKANEAGEVVSVRSGQSIVRLDDLVDAIRNARDAKQDGISCSIEPTAEGIQRYARLRPRMRSFNTQAVRAMEKAIGPQQVIVAGIEADSHFARVMIAADYVMKRIAMGFDVSPVKGMPSYLELLRRRSSGVALSSPRWWMAVDYDPMVCTSDRLAWKIRGRGVKTMTEDSVLTAGGTRLTKPDENPLAQQWADSMTEHYDELSSSLPVFGELRNCFDLAVVGALMASEGLAVRADCDLPVLMDPSRLQGPRLSIAKSIPSKASLTKGRNGWIVSVSGGVKIDAWSVVDQVKVDDSLEPVRTRASNRHETRWWW